MINFKTLACNSTRKCAILRIHVTHLRDPTVLSYYITADLAGTPK